jgi:hypothetical protein
MPGPPDIDDIDKGSAKPGSASVGIVGVEWDEAAQLATINYTSKPSVTFSATQIPNNVPKTVAGYQAWADANVQQLLNAKGFEAFIAIKVRTVNATTGFVTLEFLIFGTQKDRDEYIFPDPTLPPPLLQTRRVRARSR